MPTKNTMRISQALKKVRHRKLDSLQDILFSSFSIQEFDVKGRGRLDVRKRKFLSKKV